MARYSELAPVMKTGTYTYNYPADFATFGAFTQFLKNNSFAENSDVILEIANGTVITESFIIDGYYPYLTIKVADGGVAYVNSDDIPPLQPLPSLPSFQLMVFIYSTNFISAFLGLESPYIGLKGIYGRFVKQGVTKPLTFSLLTTDTALTLGRSAALYAGIQARPLQIEDFEQAAVAASLVGLEAYIRVTKPAATGFGTYTYFGGFLNITAGVATRSIAIEPFGTVDCEYNNGDFLSMNGMGLGSVEIQTGNTPFNIKCSNYIQADVGKGFTCNISHGIVPGTAGNLNNCSVSCKDTPFQASSGTMNVEGSLPPFILAFTSVNIGTAIIAQVYNDSAFKIQGFSAELRFDAASLVGSYNYTTPLFYCYDGADVTYPDYINFTVGPGGANPEFVGIGNFGGEISRFRYYATLDYYYNKLVNKTLSATTSFQSVNLPKMKLLVEDTGQNGRDTTVYADGTSLTNGINLGSIYHTGAPPYSAERPQDVLSNGKFYLESLSGDIRIGTIVTGLNVQGYSLPANTFVQNGSNCIWTRTGAAKFSAQTLWMVNESRYEELNSKSMELPVSTNGQYSTNSAETVWLTATAPATLVQLLDTAKRPGDSVTFINTSAFTISGSVQPGSTPFTLNAGQSMTVFYYWNDGTGLFAAIPVP